MTAKEALKLLKNATANNKDNKLNSRFGTDCNCAIWVLEQEIESCLNEIDSMGKTIDKMEKMLWG